MLENRIGPNINIFSNQMSSMPIDEFSQKGFGASAVKSAGNADFKTVFSGLVTKLNNEVEKPDQLLNESLMGNPNVDVHDVMTAIAKADIGITLATQVTSKVVTAYNTVMNISI